MGKFLVGLVLMIATLSLEAGTTPEEMFLRDYRPRSIFQIPASRVEKSRYPIIDVHSHDYARNDADITRWVSTMDAVGIQKVIILSGATGRKFDEIVGRYRKYPDRFEVWCGIDYTGFRDPTFGPAAVAELERCFHAGARGVGELSDKGRGLGATADSLGMHIDDSRMDPILKKCAELKMAVNIHVGEDRWMYEPMDPNNDGLMNAWKWKVAIGPGILGHDEVVNSLETAVRNHPGTIFIACHLANCCSDLNRFGEMLDKNPNLYGDIGARYAELSPIPRFVKQFLSRYQDRIFYGTDMNPDPEMYRVTFRLLETADEHFYPEYFRNYHWPMHAFDLPDGVLQKLYHKNAESLLKH
jgi:uncharacterized protein